METLARGWRRSAGSLNRTGRRMDGSGVRCAATDDGRNRLCEAAGCAIRACGSAFGQVRINIIVVTYVSRRSLSTSCRLVDVTRQAAYCRASRRNANLRIIHVPAVEVLEFFGGQRGGNAHVFRPIGS